MELSNGVNVWEHVIRLGHLPALVPFYLSLLVILLLPHKSKIHVAKNICILQSLPISHEIVNPSANIQEASRGYQHFLVLM